MLVMIIDGSINVEPSIATVFASNACSGYKHTLSAIYSYRQPLMLVVNLPVVVMLIHSMTHTKTDYS